MYFDIEPEVIFPGLIHLHFNTQYEVASTFMRLQEFYESSYDSVRGHVFTMEHYMDKYAADTGNFTYTIDWSGFNVPGKVIDDFRDLFTIAEFLQKEQHILDLIEKTKDSSWDKYYVIASSTEGNRKNAQKDVMKHEIAHGMWYLNEEYKVEQQKNMKGVRKNIGDRLLEMGYCKDVIEDETQAYFATSSMVYLADDGFEGCKVQWPIVLETQRTFDKFYDQLIEGEDNE